jgi:demethylmenaquinone methyltransferase/2-methoxy-6-polyprenyl-1,4-benzoquinol methylase
VHDRPSGPPRRRRTGRYRRRRPGVQPEQRQERTLNDGSRHHIYKRFFTRGQLAEELDGEVLFERQRFIAARVTWSAS